jgi:ribosomal protein S12 methylthiotransferase accessory factor YcaO
MVHVYSVIFPALDLYAPSRQMMTISIRSREFDSMPCLAPEQLLYYGA